MSGATNALTPLAIGYFSDFYTSIEHADKIRAAAHSFPERVTRHHHR